MQCKGQNEGRPHDEDDDDDADDGDVEEMEVLPRRCIYFGTGTNEFAREAHGRRTPKICISPRNGR